MCSHSIMIRTRTFHGDAIYQIYANNRSEWKCSSCGKVVWSTYLNKIIIQPWYKGLF